MATHDSNDRASWAGDGERYRSTPLRPAVWMTGVLVWATVVALILRVPTWASVFLCTLTGVSFLWFMACYVYLFASDREALRAERWRGRSARTSSHDASAQQPSEDQQRYLGPERAEFAVKGTDAGEARVSVGAAGRVREP
jgi:hypothetical protein